MRKLGPQGAHGIPGDRSHGIPGYVPMGSQRRSPCHPKVGPLGPLGPWGTRDPSVDSVAFGHKLPGCLAFWSKAPRKRCFWIEAPRTAAVWVVLPGSLEPSLLDHAQLGQDLDESCA